MTTSLENAIKKGYEALDKRYSVNASQVLDLAKQGGFNAVFDIFALGYHQGMEDAKAEMQKGANQTTKNEIRLMCNVKEIENIYYNFIQSDEYTDFGDMRLAMDRAYNRFIAGLPIKEVVAAEEIINSAAAANEKQGFVYGFQYAAKLLMGGN